MNGKLKHLHIHFFTIHTSENATVWYKIQYTPDKVQINNYTCDTIGGNHTQSNRTQLIYTTNQHIICNT